MKFIDLIDRKIAVTYWACFDLIDALIFAEAGEVLEKACDEHPVTVRVVQAEDDNRIEAKITTRYTGYI